MYVQNIPVCTSTTRTCVTTCGRGAGTHGDVLNLHTDGLLYIHTGRQGVIVSSACWTKRRDLMHERVTRHRAFSERIAMMSAAWRSITSLRYDRALSRAVLARSRAHGADPARQLFQVGDVVYYWRGNGKAKREWAAHWHGLATIIGLQHESLWLAHRTTVKCSKGHVRHATASEQLPLGPMLDAFCAPPVLPGPDLQSSEDLFMDLDEQPSKRPRDTPQQQHSTV